MGDHTGDLAALDIVGRRWYTFEDTGRAPSPRSGLCMSADGSKIYVVGGKSGVRDKKEISRIYTLDTSKLKLSEKVIGHSPQKE